MTQNVNGVDTSFQTMVAETCDRLQEKRIRYSLNRLRDMETALDAIEAELDAFLAGRSVTGRAAV